MTPVVDAEKKRVVIIIVIIMIVIVILILILIMIIIIIIIGKILKKPKTNSVLDKIADALSTPMPKLELPAIPAFPPPLAQPEIDEIRGFCYLVEKKLRNLPENKTNKVMLDIHKLLFEVEIKL